MAAPQTGHGSSESPYNYVPSKPWGVVFLVLFGLATTTHFIQALRFRTWWLFPTIIFAGILELVCWACRFWSSLSPTLDLPFKIQITAGIIAPTPLVAANFIVLGRIISVLGPSFSRLRPRLYSIIFCTADVIALVVQAAGGAIAATAKDRAGSDQGSKIMLGGIIFQMIMMIIFVICAVEFLFRYWKKMPLNSATRTHARGTLDSGIKILIAGLAASTTLLLIRAVYRTIELTDGWNGTVISTEWLFIVFDGFMVSFAMFSFNLAHPGALLADTQPLDVPKDVESTGSSVSLHERPSHFA